MIKKAWILFIAALFWAEGAFAQGGTALPFSRIDRNPVTSALAGAGAAYNGSAAYSAFGNAAMLPFFDGTLDAALSYQRWAPDLSVSNNVSVGAAYKIMPQLGLSLGYTLENGAAYEIYEGPGDPSGFFYPKNHVIALGVGVGITDMISVGMNLRYIRDASAYGYIHSGVNADIFAGVQLNEALRITAGLSTLGTLVAGSWSQPASAKAAVDWAPVLSGDHALDIMADADLYFSGSFSAAAGLQYAFRQMLYVRAGYRFASETCVIPGHLALGLGIQFSGLRLDFSWLTASLPLGNTVNVGLGYSF
jgi:hypothetical protein